MLLLNFGRPNKPFVVCNGLTWEKCLIRLLASRRMHFSHGGTCRVAFSMEAPWNHPSQVAHIFC